MPRTDWIPARLAPFALFAANFNSLVATNYTAYGVAPADMTSLGAANSAFQSAYTAAKEPSTRTKPAVATLNSTKKALVALIRRLGQVINNNSAVSNAQREALGLTVKQTNPTPIAPPSTTPIVSLAPAGGGVVNVRLADSATPAKRARPFGVSGCDLYATISPASPTGGPSDSYLGRFSRAKFSLTVPSSMVGQTIKVVGRWVNTRQQHGATGGVATVQVAA